MGLERIQEDNSHLLAEMIIDNGHPDKNSSTRVIQLSFSFLTNHSPEHIDLLNNLTIEATKSKDKSVKKQHKTCLHHILNSLILCIFRFEWLALPTNESNFIEGSYYQTLGFSRRRMQRCIEALIDNGVMVAGRKGFKSGNALGTEGKSSQFYPTDEFIQHSCNMLYQDYGDFEALNNDDLYQFKRFEENDIPTIDEYNHKVQIIRNHNQFMSAHSWAMKNASHRSIKDFDCRSGRIINMYQSLANRRIPIRTNTLLDGVPISEPDFSANHLRMAAFLLGHELPDDPYTEISKQVHLSRDQVKHLVTRCIGASRLSQKGGIIVSSPKQKVPVPILRAKATIDAFIAQYPWLVDAFFNDLGPRLQYLEGEIGLRMMEWSVNHEVPLICVHDAYAVRNFDADVTYQEMHAAWHRVLEEAKHNDFLNNSSFTTEIVYERNKG